MGGGTLVATNQRISAAIKPSVIELQEWINQNHPTLNIDETPWPVKDQALGVKDYAVELGLAFMNPGPDGYLLIFWLTAALLLVALIGAIVIAREDI